MTDAVERIAGRLTRVEDLLAALRRDHADLVSAAEGDNGDDEHDPEGATLAWEREHTAALIARSEAEREALRSALGRARDGSYGRCERCGSAIPTERLEVRPSATTCVACA
ncbi:DksA/TraR C4-type zinc finger protein [Mumia flava]|uniref:DksA/TraR C4-type zinc finger protein n=1 Tax=Mumia flava TaxID=1348852 RepID=A0A0B2BVV8_9ACTN|nr:TraR/DksA C4-type zinc finger protein [Mumia flava]PJJ48188.1 DksA/TraR C4-type zinc finger protein [Mumia flava]